MIITTISEKVTAASDEGKRKFPRTKTTETVKVISTTQINPTNAKSVARQIKSRESKLLTNNMKS